MIKLQPASDYRGREMVKDEVRKERKRKEKRGQKNEEEGEEETEKVLGGRMKKQRAHLYNSK